MGAFSREKNLSRLIPKNHFCSMSFFREPPLINWTYTKSVLFTAYDVHRSTDFWLDKVINSGQTLKEGLVELGFPKNNSIVVDTGIFEMEAKKAGIARDLGVDVSIELTNNQIFEAYELSGADYYVAPDEIVLPEEPREQVDQKIAKIKDNLLDLLDIIPASKIIAVIQGHSQPQIEELYNFYRDQNIECFAMGGVIPLYRHSKEKLHEVLSFVRELTKNHWLHVFGLPRMSLLHYYLHQIGVDSVDTSALLYLTARRQYLIQTKGVQVREAKFSECSCKGCLNLDPRSAGSSEFFVNLYIHNILEAVKVSKSKSSHLVKTGKKEAEIQPIQIQDVPTHPSPLWMTAEESLERKRGEDKDLSSFLQPNNDSKYLEYDSD